MNFEITTLTIDLKTGRARVVLDNADDGRLTRVAVNVQIQTPGNPPEDQLERIARDAAKKTLQEALSAL